MANQKHTIKWGADGEGMDVREPAGVGIIGCGNVLPLYLENIAAFNNLSIRSCADILMAKAHDAAARFSIPKACTVDELLRDDEVDIVLNLTVPTAHVGVSLAALMAHKAVYTEKPIALALSDAVTVRDEAAKRGLPVACAPDTFLGQAVQTARDVIDRGAIGKPRLAVASFAGGGDHSLAAGAGYLGPLYDIGPYYITNLVSLLGPVQSVLGLTANMLEHRPKADVGSTQSVATLLVS
ncbi:MAG: Gfo/Idh/MocA family oxidoreductase, partial [Chloroflexota bacterium]|nr:Gfo/Idh/MocA family oxidoreductase [Chloroflexota bacterium]